MNIVVLNGNEMTNKKQLHKYIAAKLDLPDYYGNNLDALADCLSEIDPDIVIVICDKESMLKQLGEYGETLLQVFQENLDKSQLIIC